MQALGTRRWEYSTLRVQTLQCTDVANTTRCEYNTLRVQTLRVQTLQCNVSTWETTITK
jgi:hypothetical protein